MSLNDCVVPTSGEIIDPVLTVAGMSIFDSVTTTDTEERPIIAATWTAPTGAAAAYVTGVQFEYYPDYMSPPITRTQPQAAAAAAWQTSDGVFFSGVYKVRWRAVGVGSSYGNWSGYTTVTMDPAPAGPAPEVPADPTGVSAAASFELFTTGVRNAKLVITFDDPALSGIEYRVRWKRDTDDTYQYQTFSAANDLGSTMTVTIDTVPTGVTIESGIQFVPQGRTDLASNFVDADPVDTTPSNTIPTPTTLEWGAAGATVTSDDSTTQFGIIRITGAVDSGNLPLISNITLRIKRSADSNWTSKQLHLKTETHFEFEGLLPQTSYDVELAYVAFEESGTALVFTGIVTGSLTVPGGTPPNGTILVNSYGAGADSLTVTWAGTIRIELTGASGAYGSQYNNGKDPPVDPGNPGSGAYCSSDVVVSPGDTFNYSSGVVGGGDATCTGPGGLNMTGGGGGDSSADEFGGYDGAGGTASGGTTNTNGSSGAGDGSTNATVYISKIA